MAELVISLEQKGDQGIAVDFGWLYGCINGIERKPLTQISLDVFDCDCVD